MRRAASAFFLVAMAAGCCFTSGAVAARAQAQEQAKTAARNVLAPCAISGKMIDAATGNPIDKAWLILRPDHDWPPGSPPKPRAVQTDAAGHFEIDNLAAGNYETRAGRNGYLFEQYFVDSKSRKSSIDCAFGAPDKDILFRLTPGGVIKGRVSDDQGEPAPWVTVFLYRVGYTEHGRAKATGGTPLVADDRGEYRFSNLGPGRYYLVARSQNPFYTFGLAGRSIQLAGQGSPLVCPTEVFYPGVADAERAETIELKPGERVTGNITIRPVREYRVTGQVTNLNVGGPDATGFVSLSARSGPLRRWRFGRGSLNFSTGTFEIKSVPAGSYVLEAYVKTRYGAFAGLGEVPVDVRERNVTGVHVAVETSTTIDGALKVEGGMSPVLAVADVQLLPMNPSKGWREGVVKNDGSFHIPGIEPGSYRLRLETSRPRLYLKSASYGGADLLKVPLVAGGPPRGTMHLVVSLHPAEVDGTVADENGKPTAGAEVVLVPNPPSPQRYWLYHWSFSSEGGRFRIVDVPPGRYKVYAWWFQERRNFEWFDPERMRAAKAYGVRVDVAEGEHKDIQVKVAPDRTGSAGPQ